MAQTAELWEFFKPSFAEEITCDAKKFSQFPQDVPDNVTLVLTIDSKPILCHKQCHVFVCDNWITTEHHGEILPRSNSKHITVLENTVLVAGGQAVNGDFMTSTDLISLDSNDWIWIEAGPELPFKKQLACLTMFNDTLAIGVLNDPGKAPIILGYDIHQESWRILSTVNADKTFGGKKTILDCDVLADSAQNIHVAFIGISQNGVDAGTGIWDVFNNNWFIGPDVPNAVDTDMVLSTADRSGVLVLSAELDNVLELRCHDGGHCQWIVHEAQLHDNSNQTFAMHLPGHLLGCEGKFCLPTFLNRYSTTFCS